MAISMAQYCTYTVTVYIYIHIDISAFDGPKFCVQKSVQS